MGSLEETVSIEKKDNLNQNEHMMLGVKLETQKWKRNYLSGFVNYVAVTFI